MILIAMLLNYTFMQHALIASILSSVVCGIIGTIIVEKKIVSLSGGIAHASFGGIGLGYLLGFEPLIGGIMFAIGSSIGINTIKRRSVANDDTLIGIFWSVGMAMGILFISLTPGYLPDITTYLFGDILTVSHLYVKIISVLAGIIVSCILMFYNYWKAYLFDEEFLKVLKVNVVFLEYFIYILISLSIILVIKVVGIMLSMALLTIPVSTSKLVTYDFKNIMIFSIIIGIAESIFGLISSYYLNIPSGATIIIIAMIVYFVILMISKIINWKS